MAEDLLDPKTVAEGLARIGCQPVSAAIAAGW